MAQRPSHPENNTLQLKAHASEERDTANLSIKDTLVIEQTLLCGRTGPLPEKRQCERLKQHAAPLRQQMVATVSEARDTRLFTVKRRTRSRHW